MSSRFMIASKYDVEYAHSDLGLMPDTFKELCDKFEVPINFSRDDADMYIVDVEIDAQEMATTIRYLCNQPLLYEKSEIVKKCCHEAYLECNEGQTQAQCLGEHLKEYFSKGTPDRYGFYHLAYL